MSSPAASAMSGAALYRRISEALQRAFAPNFHEAATAAGIIAAVTISAANRAGALPPRVFTPGAAGRFAPAAPKPRAPARPSTAAPIRRRAPAGAEPDHARPAQRHFPPEALILQTLIKPPWLLHDIWRRWPPRTGPPRGPQIARRHHLGFAGDIKNSEPSEQAEKLRADLECGGLSQILSKG